MPIPPVLVATVRLVDALTTHGHNPGAAAAELAEFWHVLTDDEKAQVLRGTAWRARHVPLPLRPDDAGRYAAALREQARAADVANAPERYRTARPPLADELVALHACLLLLAAIRTAPPTEPA